MWLLKSGSPAVLSRLLLFVSFLAEFRQLAGDVSFCLTPDWIDFGRVNHETLPPPPKILLHFPSPMARLAAFIHFLTT